VFIGSVLDLFQVSCWATV